MQRSVARWESAATVPDERYQLLLAHLYVRTPSGDLAAAAGSDLAEFLDALGQLGESADRIAELRTTLIRTATDGAVLNAAVAHDHFARSAAALTAPREQVQRAIVAMDQALARIRMNDPRAAAELLHDCITAATSAGGRVPAIRLRRARQELRPWRREDFVADLDDHLMDIVDT
ncbi:hypothetical protein ACIQ7D_14230 [Streptomyces sp. NPDC096310]|uniref:hypothetical protein n=1 Tax=Streptomyces sp. NPDC096310 TaxID=3366082 RepID=UPI00382CD659